MNEKIEEINEELENEKLYCGRMISAYKQAPKGHLAVFNANLIHPTLGKIWFGDLNITKEGEKLKRIASKFNTTLYVLREMDCRFDTENEDIPTLIKKAVWNTQ